MTNPVYYLTQGARIFASSWKNRFFQKKYSGSAEEICRQIVKNCWNGRFFQASTGNFRQFWTRDFGWCVKSLMELGYKKEVHQTLRYALNRFQKYKEITTTITPGGRPFDFPTYAADSLPWLIRSIKVSAFPHLLYQKFLNQEIKKYYELVINKDIGLVKPEAHFSSIKDFARRKSSCYDNCMAAMLAKDLSGMKLENPFGKFNYPELIQRHFWNGRYFHDDLSKKDYVAGDANIFPFALSIISDQKMLHSAMSSIREAGLDEPFPLKYTAGRKDIKFIWQEIFLRNYESSSIWTHMGPMYIKLLAQADKSRAEEYKKKYAELIEKYKNYMEIFKANGKPFSTPFYYCDSGMLWAANYLTL